MLCVEQDINGVILALDPQPADVSLCPLVLVSGPEAALSPWALTPEQGAEIGGAILLVWAIAFGFRAVARTLSTAQSKEE